MIEENFMVTIQVCISSLKRLEYKQEDLNKFFGNLLGSDQAEGRFNGQYISMKFKLLDASKYDLSCDKG